MHLLTLPGMASNTHTCIDQFFSRLAAHVKQRYIWTCKQQADEFKRAFTKLPVYAQHLINFFNVKDLLIATRIINRIHGISKWQAFRLQRYPLQGVNISFKKRGYDAHWTGSQWTGSMLFLKFAPYMTTAPPYILKQVDLIVIKQIKTNHAGLDRRLKLFFLGKDDQYEAIRADMTKSVTILQVSRSQYLGMDFSMYNENADPDQHRGEGPELPGGAGGG
ncbi:unnamed protein product [Discosporangium mesarthrocarpum]